MTSLNDLNNEFSCNHSDKSAIEIVREYRPDFKTNCLNVYTVKTEFSRSVLESIGSQFLTMLKENPESDLYKLCDYLNNYKTWFEIMDAIQGQKWIVQKGEYAGTWLKRFNSYLYKNHNVKIEPRIISGLGSYIGKLNESESEKIYRFDLTDNINWGNNDFGQNSSCYWSFKPCAIPTILINGGLAFRTFKSESYNIQNGLSRFWLLPYRTGLIAFNGYGMELITQVRILADYL